MGNNEKLSITESSDFYLLLELMVPLYDVEEYAWLPELFSIIGHERLIELAKYAGGETIKIPTLQEITSAIEALDWYYRKSIPVEYLSLVDKIKDKLDA